MIIPEGFPKPLPSAFVTAAQSGAWYKKEFNGQGLDIYIKDRNDKTEVVNYWYTYKNEMPIWYTCHGFVEDGCVEFEILSPQGGTWDDPTTRENVVVGDGQLYFLNDELGIFNYNTVDYVRGGFEITPIILTNHDLDGCYYQVDKDGSGFGFRFFTRPNEHGVLIDYCVGYWYNFDDLGRQVWYHCSGVYITELGEYEIKLRELLGGQWMYYTKPSKEVVGTAFLDPDTMEFNYDIDASGVSDVGVLNLITLF